MTQEKQRALFLVYHGLGHFNATLALANAISSRYDVVYAGHRSFEKHIRQLSYRYYILNSIPFGTGLESWFNKIQKKNFSYVRTIIDRWNNKLFHLREAELSRMIHEVQPDLILLDAQLSTDFIALYPLLVHHEIAFATLHTMLPTAISDEIPPLNSLSLPGNAQEIQRENKKVLRGIILRRFLQKVKYFGSDDHAIIRKTAATNDVPSSFIDFRSSFGISLRGITELILAPRGFNFRESIVKENQHYLGPGQRYAPSTDHAMYFAKRVEIYNLINTQKLKLIYCGFGSLPGENEKTVVSLLRNIIAAIQDQPYHMIVALNLEEKKRVEFNNSQVSVFKTVPQVEVLSRADLFITHGGFNSLKESIFRLVPMLVFPIEFKTDHPGNAARIVYHRLGLRGDAKKDSASAIKEKIETLLSDGSFKRNLQAFQQDEKEMDDEALLSIVQSIPEFQNVVTPSQARDDQPR